MERSDESASDPSSLATGLLLVVGARSAVGCLEWMFVAPAQTTVGENPLPELLRPNFRKRWQLIDRNVGESGRRTARGGPFGRHGKEDSGGCRRRRMINELETAPRSRLMDSRALIHAIPGLDQLMNATGHPPKTPS